MKLSTTNLSWNFQEDIALKIMQQNEFKFIELSLTKKFNNWDSITPNKLIEYKNFLNDNYGIKICSLQSLFYGLQINLFQDTDLFKQHFKKILEFANILNCKYIVFGSPYNRRLNGIEYLKAKEIFIKCFDELSDYNKDIIIGIETNPAYYKNEFIKSYDECMEITKIINKQNIVFHYDLGCILLNNDDYEKIYDKEKNNLHLLHLSCKDLDFVYDKQSVQNFLSIIDYKKHIISIEMLNQTSYHFEKSLTFVKSILN